MTAETINLEPDWAGVRHFVRELGKTDEAAARRIAAEMGHEAPAEFVTDPEQHAAAVEREKAAARCGGAGAFPDAGGSLTIACEGCEDCTTKGEA